jgi:hypothetical protein
MESAAHPFWAGAAETVVWAAAAVRGLPVSKAAATTPATNFDGERILRTSWGDSHYSRTEEAASEHCRQKTTFQRSIINLGERHPIEIVVVGVLDTD